MGLDKGDRPKAVLATCTSWPRQGDVQERSCKIARPGSIFLVSDRGLRDMSNIEQLQLSNWSNRIERVRKLASDREDRSFLKDLFHGVMQRQTSSVETFPECNTEAKHTRKLLELCVFVVLLTGQGGADVRQGQKIRPF